MWIRFRNFDLEYWLIPVLYYSKINVETRVKVFLFSWLEFFIIFFEINFTVTIVWNTRETGDIHIGTIIFGWLRTGLVTGLWLNMILSFLYRPSTRIGAQSFDICLKNKPRFGTPICQSLAGTSTSTGPQCHSATITVLPIYQTQNCLLWRKLCWSFRVACDLCLIRKLVEFWAPSTGPIKTWPEWIQPVDQRL